MQAQKDRHYQGAHLYLDLSLDFEHQSVGGRVLCLLFLSAVWGAEPRLNLQVW